jgi:hypothetical protein
MRAGSSLDCISICGPGISSVPGGETRLLAEADFHGAWVRWQ